jgi:hypothetical protein
MADRLKRNTEQEEMVRVPARVTAKKPHTQSLSMCQFYAQGKIKQIVRHTYFCRLPMLLTRFEFPAKIRYIFCQFSFRVFRETTKKRLFFRRFARD